MTNTELKNQIVDIQKEAGKDSITYDICKDALEEQTDFENPVEYLLERYDDTSLYYHFDEAFFTSYISDILFIINAYPKKVESINSKNLVKEASYLAYQIYLQDILIELDVLKKEDAQF